MEWNEAAIDKLNKAFMEKYKAMFSDKVQDRKNRSALWNKYIKNYDAKIVRNDIPGKSFNKNVLRGTDIVLGNLIRTINLNNEIVSSGLVIHNPDRYGQFIIISRDIAERILVLGMM